MKLKLLGLVIVLALLYLGYTYYSSQQVQETAATPVLRETSAYTSDDAHTFPLSGKTSYKMELYLDNTSRTLNGVTYIYTVNNRRDPLNELCFTVYPQAFASAQSTPAPTESYYAGFNPGGIDIAQIWINGAEAEGIIEGITLKTELPRNILSQEQLEIKMVWETKIPRLAYRFGYNEGVYMLGAFHTILNVLTDDGWCVSYNSPFGDPFCFSSADYQAEINIPETMSLVSAGAIMDIRAEDNGRQIILAEAKNVRDFSLAVMYDYKKADLSKNNTLVEVYAPGKKAGEINNIAYQAEEILNYYASSWGSYPYPEFKVVFVPMRGFYGMEYSGMIFLRDECLDPGYDRNRFDFLLAHEIAHQWWYGMVGNNQFKEAWLDEGLANWSAYKYLQTYKNQSPPAVIPNYKTNVNLALSDIRNSQAYYLAAYNGGEAFWLNLEQVLGTETVNNILRRYLADYRYKIATGQDLVKIINWETDRDMTAFLARWSLVYP